MSALERIPEIITTDDIVHTELVATQKLKIEKKDLTEFVDLFMDDETIGKEFEIRNWNSKSKPLVVPIILRFDTKEFTKGILEVTFTVYRVIK